MLLSTQHLESIACESRNEVLKDDSAGTQQLGQYTSEVLSTC